MGNPSFSFPRKILSLWPLNSQQMNGRYVVWYPEISCIQISQLYDNYERKSHIQINRFIRRGTLLKKYVLSQFCVPFAERFHPSATAILVYIYACLTWWSRLTTSWQAMILRLRQLCGHPNLILVCPLILLTNELTHATESNKGRWRSFHAHGWREGAGTRTGCSRHGAGLGQWCECSTSACYQY